MSWHLFNSQCYGLTQFKRYASTCTMSYTVADLGVVGCRQHYLSQTDSDKGLHWYFDIRAFCMGQPNQQSFHLGTHCRCEYDSAFGLWSMLRSEPVTERIKLYAATCKVSCMAEDYYGRCKVAVFFCSMLTQSYRSNLSWKLGSIWLRLSSNQCSMNYPLR